MEICNFLRFKERTGDYTEWAIQNFFAGEGRELQGVSYRFAPIAMGISAGTRGGDRSEAAISGPSDQITMNVFYEAVKKDWLLEAKTVKVNRVDFSLGQLLSSELWAVSQIQYDISLEGVVLQLTSPLDSVSRIGGRFLSRSLVGALPTSGSLTLQ